ncbi:MAG TPA: hypothetical protein EYP24_05920 [bacterium (Candidatus Stahlbacteria)]|nr:hypothetical protein [Candidatus Stahlbacteria bacterium]
MRSQSRIITFLSDFGLKDYYVGAVKGEILKLNPEVKIVDIGHDLEPFDVAAAAYLLESYFQDFPDGTIHLVVVDPSLARREPVILVGSDYYFVGPDNGVFDPILANYSLKRFVIKVESVISVTFHGRDLFGPTAARISLGVDPEELGILKSRKVEPDTGPVRIIHIDRFGNLVTNLRKKSGKIKIKGIEIPIVPGYGEVKKGELLALVGSTGRVEISVREGSAEEYLNVSKGEEIEYLD